MKISCWLVIGMSVATGALAQTNSLPPIPAPLTTPVMAAPPAAVVSNPPVKKAATVKHKKKAGAKKIAAAKTSVAKPAAFTAPTVTLNPGPAEVAVDN